MASCLGGVDAAMVFFRRVLKGIEVRLGELLGSPFLRGKPRGLHRGLFLRHGEQVGTIAGLQVQPETRGETERLFQECGSGGRKDDPPVDQTADVLLGEPGEPGEVFLGQMFIFKLFPDCLPRRDELCENKFHIFCHEIT